MTSFGVGLDPSPVNPAKAGTHGYDAIEVGAAHARAASMGPGLRRDDEGMVAAPLGIFPAETRDQSANALREGAANQMNSTFDTT